MLGLENPSAMLQIHETLQTSQALISPAYNNRVLVPLSHTLM